MFGFVVGGVLWFVLVHVRWWDGRRVNISVKSGVFVMKSVVLDVWVGVLVGVW